MNQMKPQIIITGVSGSGKTTLVNELIAQIPQCRLPVQYTTRSPRDDSELDNYVFLTHSQFMKKLELGDFIQFTNYNGALYAISSYIDTSNSNCFIVEPVGKASLIKHFKINGIPYIPIFIKCEEEIIKQRLINRGHTIQEIENRLLDFKYFTPSNDDKIFSGDRKTQINVDLIKKYLGVL